MEPASNKLIAPANIKTERPDWPFSYDSTMRLIRLGELGAVRVGRRRFLTPELIDAFITSHTAVPDHAAQRR